MSVRLLFSDNKPNPPAAGKFGIVPGVEVRAYQPLGCPSLEQFEARYQASAFNSTPKAA